MSSFKSVALVSAVFLLFSLGASAKDNARQPKIQKEWAAWLKSDMKREARAKKSTPIGLGNGVFIGSVQGELAEAIRRLDNGWFFAVDIGAENTMQCWVILEESNLTAALTEIHRILIDQLANANGETVTTPIPYYLYADIVDGSPMATSEFLVKIGAESPKVAFSKVRIANRDGGSLICAHIDIGFRKTFARVFEEFLTSVSMSPGYPEPYYEESYRISIGGRPAGIATNAFRKDEDGSTVVTSSTSMLLQVDPTSVMSSDTDHVEYVGADGSLLEAASVTHENGEVTTNLVLEPTDDGPWSVSGTFSGKEVSVSIDAAVAPLSALGQMLAVRDAIAAKNTSRVAFPVWLPEIDPSSFMEGSLTIEKIGRKTSRGVLTTGPIAMKSAFDRNGSPVEAEVELGPNVMRVERVDVRGRLPDHHAN